MKCPACKETLIILELHEIEVDYCTNCKGIWLDEGELELMLEEESEKKKLLRSLHYINSSKEKYLRCPVCKVKMNKVKHQDTEIITDRCTNKHGFWFDKDELESLIKFTSAKPDNNRFYKMIKELFGKKENNNQHHEINKEDNE